MLLKSSVDFSNPTLGIISITILLLFLHQTMYVNTNQHIAEPVKHGAGNRGTVYF